MGVEVSPERSAPDGGLREARKRRTRRALVEAALDLALDRGLEATTAEDVAQRAGVSARTFFNYFATKDAVFAAPGLDVAARLVELVRAAPPCAPDPAAVWAVLRGAALAVLREVDADAPDPAVVRKRAELVRRHPELAGRALVALPAVQAELRAELAARLGGGGAPGAPGGPGGPGGPVDLVDLDARLLAEAVRVAVQVAVELWAGGVGPGPGRADAAALVLDRWAPALAAQGTASGAV